MTKRIGNKTLRPVSVEGKNEALSKSMKGNSNAIRHGAFMKLQKANLDGRSRLVKYITALKDAMIQDLGGNITVAQEIIIDRVKFKVANAYMKELSVMKGEGEMDEFYLRLANSIRADLMALGLERQDRDYVTPLKQYIAQKDKKDTQDIKVVKEDEHN